LGEDDIASTFGAPSSGKSVIVGDRNAHIAAGLNWFEHRVMKCAVLHVAAERARVVKRRYAAFRKYHDIQDLPLAVVSGSVDLRTSPNDAKLIAEYCKRLEDAKGVCVGLVSIETVNRVLAGGDENSPKDMGSLVDKLCFLQEITGACIDIVHHIPADGTQRLRGHGALLGRLDMTARVEKRGKVRTYTVDKANDGIEGASVAFDLKSVDLHFDPETGVTTTAPVVIPATAPPRAEGGISRPPSATQTLAHEALVSLAAEKGEPLSPALGLPASIRAIAIAFFKSEMLARGIVDRDGKNPHARFNEITKGLKVRKLAAERDGRIWPILKGS
jgi:AAA domain